METPEIATTESTTATPLPCRYLRCKEMFHDGRDDDEFSSGLYWCSRTQEATGPDGVACGKKECCAQRTCYVT
jgi:hypothetical protein